MQVNISTVSGVTTLHPRGRFDFNAHREFRDGTDSVLADKSVSAIVVDFQEVEYLDSSALGMLLMLRDKAKTANKRVSLSNCHGPVKQVLDIANFAKLFDIA